MRSLEFAREGHGTEDAVGVQPARTALDPHEEPGTWRVRRTQSVVGLRVFRV